MHMTYISDAVINYVRQVLRLLHFKFQRSRLLIQIIGDESQTGARLLNQREI